MYFEDLVSSFYKKVTQFGNYTEEVIFFVDNKELSLRLSNFVGCCDDVLMCYSDISDGVRIETRVGSIIDLTDGDAYRLICIMAKVKSLLMRIQIFENMVNICEHLSIYSKTETSIKCGFSYNDKLYVKYVNEDMSEHRYKNGCFYVYEDNISNHISYKSVQKFNNIDMMFYLGLYERMKQIAKNLYSEKIQYRWKV